MSVILYNKKAGIANITLNRPKSLNSINTTLAYEWIAALDDCKKDDRIRVVVITGSGRAFCVGQDLKEVSNKNLMPGFNTLLEKHYRPIVQKIITLEKPVIAAVNGVAAGAGANFALACDLVVASEKASFIQAFSSIGLIPDSGGTYLLPRIIGRARAMAYAMLGDKINAQDAEKIGMIYKCVPAISFEQEIKKLSKRLAQMATKGLGLIKRSINQSYKNTFEEQLLLETQLQIEASETHDYSEGVQAF